MRIDHASVRANIMLLITRKWGTIETKTDKNNDYAVKLVGIYGILILTERVAPGAWACGRLAGECGVVAACA